MAIPQRLLHALLGWWQAGSLNGWPPELATRLQVAHLWGTCAILRLRPGLPRLALLRRAHA